MELDDLYWKDWCNAGFSTHVSRNRFAMEDMLDSLGEKEPGFRCFGISLAICRLISRIVDVDVFAGVLSHKHRRL